jgi:hypothetical protein
VVGDGLAADRSPVRRARPRLALAGGRAHRAVAVAFADGPAAGLAVLDAVAGDTRLAHSHRLSATRADLLRRLGRPAEAAVEYGRALERVCTTPERTFLERRLAEITGSGARLSGLGSDHAAGES